MKHNSKQFLALFMAASMAVAPVSGVYAEDQNAAVENAVNANVQEGSEAEQNETASNAGQAESSVTAVESQEENKAEAAGKGTDTAEDEDAKKNAALAKLSVVSGTTGELKDGTYKVEAKVGGSSRTSITCEKVEVKDGKATARIVFSSAGYPKLWVNVNGTVKEYEKRTDSAAGTSAFDIPADINKEMNVIGYVEKMGSYTEYKLNINISKDTEPTTPEAPEQTVITGVSFSEGTELSMKTGEVKNLTLKFTPALSAEETAPDMTWTSSDPEVVTVEKSGSQAKLTAMKAGTAEVTATFNNSEGTEIKATCKVTVTAQETENKTLTDGNYQVNAEAGGKMIRVTNCVMTVKNGQMTAAVTLSGRGYNRIYLGDVKDAPNDESNWILPDSLLAEQYTFQIPVEKLDEVMTIAVHTTKSNKWDTRTLTFHSEGMTKIADSNNGNASNGNNGSNGSLTPGGNNNNPGNTSNGNNSGSTGSNNGNTGNNTTNNGKPDKESKYESDLNKSTARVNSATGLKDGVYTPDSFSWSGGTGKVSISCTKITVTGGQAYATIVFSSGSYGYVKANGNTYYPTTTGSTSTFVIPVELNKNNTIIGMTTKMSTAHEISYSIFIYLSAAAKADGTTVSGETNLSADTLDEKAPEIMGLSYQSETKVEHAKYFKIYHYDQGITLLEIDQRKDEDTKETKTKDTKEDTDSGLTPAQEEKLALYKAKIVRYLIVPEDAEIPAGLDKEMIVIQKPKKSAYVGSEEVLEILDKLNATDQITSVGVKQKNCKVEGIAKAMKAKKIIYAGTYKKPENKKLMKSKCDLAILSNKILPDEKNEKKMSVEDQQKRYEELAEKFVLLDVPMIVDRSADEEKDDAKAEWSKVYEAIFAQTDSTDSSAKN